MAKDKAVNFIPYNDRDTWVSCVARAIQFQLQDEIDCNGAATLIVAGGETPAPVYRELDRLPLSWQQITVIPSDERWVEPGSHRSNLGMVTNCLPTAVGSGARLIPFYAENLTPGRQASELASILSPYLPACVCLLGMGTDLHTASLFPGMVNLELAMSADAPTVLPVRAPVSNEQRLTLSASALLASKHIHIAIAGHLKRTALEKAAKMDPMQEAPVAAFLDKATVSYVD